VKRLLLSASVHRIREDKAEELCAPRRFEVRRAPSATWRTSRRT